MLTRALLAGAGAGVVGVTAMTLSEWLEQQFTHRPPSQVPGRTILAMAGREEPDDSLLDRANWATHIGIAAAAGTLRGLMAYAGLRGVRASAMFTVVRLTIDQTMENWTGVGAPPWTWPRLEYAVDVAHKTVYAMVTGLVADAVADRQIGPGPGQRHAALVGGRHADVGPAWEEHARRRRG